jgi:hypothetical protein
MDADDAGLCTLVTASCTTGWTDWIHGELWVSAQGVLRRPLGLWATIVHGVGPTVRASERPTRTLEDLRSSGDRGDLWIPWTSVVRAELRAGGPNDALHVELLDGRRVSFAWMAHDGARPYLSSVLPSMLGVRLKESALGRN